MPLHGAETAERTATVLLPSLLQAKALGQLPLPGPHLPPIYLPQAPSFSGIPQVHRTVRSLAPNPARKDLLPAPYMWLHRATLSEHRKPFYICNVSPLKLSDARVTVQTMLGPETLTDTLVTRVLPP